jgi:hypothetical protein
MGLTVLRLNFRRPDPPKLDIRAIFEQRFRPGGKVHTAVGQKLPGDNVRIVDVVCAFRAALENRELEPDEWVEALTGFGIAIKAAAVKCSGSAE